MREVQGVIVIWVSVPEAYNWWYGLTSEEREIFHKECGSPDTKPNGPVGWGPEEYLKKIKEIHPELFVKN